MQKSRERDTWAKPSGPAHRYTAKALMRCVRKSQVRNHHQSAICSSEHIHNFHQCISTHRASEPTHVNFSTDPESSRFEPRRAIGIASKRSCSQSWATYDFCARELKGGAIWMSAPQFAASANGAAARDEIVARSQSVPTLALLRAAWMAALRDAEAYKMAARRQQVRKREGSQTLDSVALGPPVAVCESRTQPGAHGLRHEARNGSLGAGSTAGLAGAAPGTEIRRLLSRLEPSEREVRLQP